MTVHIADEHMRVKCTTNV